MQGLCSVPSGMLIRRTGLLTSPDCPIVNDLPATFPVSGNICSHLVSSVPADSSRNIRFDLIRASDDLVLSSASICLTVVSAGFTSLENEEEVLY